MIFQRFLKGVVNISSHDARCQLDGSGLICNWWRQVSTLPAAQIPERLSAENLLRHLNSYEQTDSSLPPPFGLHPFGTYTTFISTASGTVERDPANAQNLAFCAFLTALSFATAGYQKSGAIYYGYVNVLGRQALKLQEFSEETRDLHQWHEYQPYHPEGEIVAKICIPAPHLEKVVGFDGPAALDDLDNGNIPSPSWTEVNTRHSVPPESVSNVRGALIGDYGLL